MRADKVNTEEYNFISIQCVYVCLGGNDINASSFPKKTYEDIVDFMSLLQNGIKTVYVCEIIIMGTFAKSPGLDKKTFDKKRNMFDN